MRIGMRKIKEKRLFFVGVNKLERFFGIALSQGAQISRLFDDFVVAKQGSAPPTRIRIEISRSVFRDFFGRFHIVRPAEAVEGIETVGRWQVLGALAKMPL